MLLINEIKAIIEDMKLNGEVVHTERWQAMSIGGNPQAKMVEILHRSISAPIKTEKLDMLSMAIGPNQPWADRHFEERVCSMPINPGVEWANWPWGTHAKESLDHTGKFNHNYMERYWPKYAGQKPAPSEQPHEYRDYLTTRWGLGDAPQATMGIRGEYGDLGSMANQLAHEPLTRQAYLPVWFPEDTGDENQGRKPCTLGYHFIMRNGKLDVTYYIRSCDLSRHFRDDIYLTIRLLLWVLDYCRAQNPEVWKDVVPGQFIMHITSLHMFVSDYQMMFKRNPG